jgi:hypothetical protein
LLVEVVETVQAPVAAEEAVEYLVVEIRRVRVLKPVVEPKPVVVVLMVVP